MAQTVTKPEKMDILSWLKRVDLWVEQPGLSLHQQNDRVVMQRRVQEVINRAHAEGVMAYQVLDLDSSRAGEWLYLPFGGLSQTTPTLDDALGAVIGDVPSRFHYPIAYYLVSEVTGKKEA